MQVVRQLWNDTEGSLSPVGLLLVITILVVGMLPGLVTFRDHVIQEFGDLAVAIESLDQSYSMTVMGTTSKFQDSTTLVDVANEEPAGIDILRPATDEG